MKTTAIVPECQTYFQALPARAAAGRELGPAVMLALLLAGITLGVHGQAYGPPDRNEPGDPQIQEYMARQAAALYATFEEDLRSAEAWRSARARHLEEYYYMLGLWPMPDKTPLRAAVTGTIEGDGYVVEMLHYQSRPQLYVTGNLYRPAVIRSGERLPAVLYVCGHSSRGRNGNKTAFQSHGIWFARHGYICLLVDTLQLGEIAALHHGTYREGRWWWHSRGYTPAGVECWNGIRGIDYLSSRADVDPERIAVTGISGGGAATFWIAAADERAKVAVPVSGMADLPSYVSNRVVNGHCDCMFLYNTFQWPWARIAALVAPRPLLFVNSDADPIFPMDANDRVINRLERIYSFYGASDMVDSVVSIGGHAYRQDIRQAAYRFIHTHLQNNPSPITDSERDLVTESRTDPRHPIDPERLRVFRGEDDLPRDELNTTIDQHFVPRARVELPGEGQFDAWKTKLLDELRRVVFRPFPKNIPVAERLEVESPDVVRLETEPGIQVTLRRASEYGLPEKPKRVVLAVNSPGAEGREEAWLRSFYQAGDVIYRCETRGVGATRWTQKNPPNYVKRSLVLLGLTEDAGRVWDVAATARFLAQQYESQVPVFVSGRGKEALIAAYAALLEQEIAGALLVEPPAGHMEASAPSLLNILRVCDVPEVLGMLAPRRLEIRGRAKWERVEQIYRRAQAAGQLSIRD